jgi:flavin-dependent dehydrogenase
MMRLMARPRDVDVLVVGGGPGGSTAATFLAQGGLSVALVERERFPRFKVGESLIPTCMAICERMGVLDKVLAHGFQSKYGATFHDQELGVSATFGFRAGRPWPAYTLDVHRAEFDQILLEHAAAQPGVMVCQPAAVEHVAFDRDGVTARIDRGADRRELRAGFMVDASGRDAFLASRQGRRIPRPSLGKIATFAYFRGARRFPGREEGHVRIYVFPEGWFWYIPLAHDETSVGCVLHQRVVKARAGSMEALFEEMIERCHAVRDNVRGSERVTEIHTVSNIAYSVEPKVGDRFVCVGDAMAFVDPIFSPGVFLAMKSGELASDAVLRAFRAGRFTARRFRAYERAVRRGSRPFERFIELFYDRAFLEVFLKPRDILKMVDAVTGVLAGGSFGLLPRNLRFSLWAFLQVVKITRWKSRRHGVVLESRLDW